MPRKTKRFFIQGCVKSVLLAAWDVQGLSVELVCPYCGEGDLVPVLDVIQWGFWFNDVWKVKQCQECYELSFVHVQEEDGTELVIEPSLKSMATETPQL